MQQYYILKNGIYFLALSYFIIPILIIHCTFTEVCRGDQSSPKLSNDVNVRGAMISYICIYISYMLVPEVYKCSA